MAILSDAGDANDGNALQLQRRKASPIDNDDPRGMLAIVERLDGMERWRKLHDERYGQLSGLVAILTEKMDRPEAEAEGEAKAKDRNEQIGSKQPVIIDTDEKIPNEEDGTYPSSAGSDGELPLALAFTKEEMHKHKKKKQKKKKRSKHKAASAKKWKVTRLVVITIIFIGFLLSVVFVLGVTTGKKKKKKKKSCRSLRERNNHQTPRKGKHPGDETKTNRSPEEGSPEYVLESATDVSNIDDVPYFISLAEPSNRMLSAPDIPSYAPTFEGGCLNLTLAVLLPKVFQVNDYVDEFYSFSWKIKTAAAASDSGLDLDSDWPVVTWVQEEFQVFSDEYIQENNLTNILRPNTITVDHANGTNAMSQLVCLPTNQSYSFQVKLRDEPNGHMIHSGLWYVLSSGDDQLKCGSFPHNFIANVYYDIDNETMFEEMLMAPNRDDAGCNIPSFYENVTTGHGLELMPLQCYYSGFIDENLGGRRTIDQQMWGHDGCRPILAEACLMDSSLGFDTVEMEDFCAYHQCVFGSEYGSDQFMDEVDEKRRISCECLYEEWYCKHGTDRCEVDTERENAYDCCVKNGNKTNLQASCECSIQPDCEAGESSERCNTLATYCPMDQECKCDYLTKACTLDLDSAPEDFTQSIFLDDYCFGAEISCCGNEQGNGGCKCDFYESICNDYPKQYGGYYCDLTAEACCDFNSQCNCDFFTHLLDNLGWQDTSNRNQQGKNCLEASNLAPDRNVEVLNLKNIYNQAGGDHWFNNTGWMTEVDHCRWHGITCDIEGLFVTEIQLRSNNVTGEFPAEPISNFYKMRTLDLADNRLWGVMGNFLHSYIDTSMFFNLRDLTHVDLSENKLSGEVDVVFVPAVEYANFSYNYFTSVNRFKRFKQSHKTLRVCDLSHNSIQHDIIHLMTNVPPNIEQYILSDNLIHGALPKSMDRLASLRLFMIDSNSLSELIPDISSYFPNLQEFNLSNQKHHGNSGLAGNIPDGLSNLPFLRLLSLSGNQLTNTISPAFGNLAQLRELDVSDNLLSKQIPTELGRLEGVLEVLDLSNNEFEGWIPSELGQLEDASVHLNGNSKITNPAPLSLCSISGFDLKDNSDLCPIERNALNNFYHSTKGGEWTDNENWVDEYDSFCSWYGATCDTSNNIIKLKLPNNGLSGKLSESIGNLSSLQVLDLSDNDIKGSIPSEIGQLSSLTYLRLAYNAFIENAPSELGELEHLELVQLHSNRISGTIPGITLTSKTHSSFVSDCGVPSAFDEPLKCDNCTMCCNSQGDCLRKEETDLQQAGLKGVEDYKTFTWVFFLVVCVTCCILALASILYGKYKDERLQGSNEQEPSLVNRDKIYALDSIGRDSVYQFFLSKSWLGWFIALATIVGQLWVLYVFVDAAEFDVSNDNSDFVYSWKCPRNKDECDNEADLDGEGWAAFVILMVAHLLKDIINSSKLIVLSGKERHSRRRRMRFFFGSFFLSAVTLFTLYVSIIYNVAIATSNTEIIINSVIILFITDVDELFYDLLMAINPDWVEEISQ